MRKFKTLRIVFLFFILKSNMAHASPFFPSFNPAAYLEAILKLADVINSASLNSEGALDSIGNFTQNHGSQIVTVGNQIIEVGNQAVGEWTRSNVIIDDHMNLKWILATSVGVTASVFMTWNILNIGKRSCIRLWNKRKTSRPKFQETELTSVLLEY